MTTRPRQPTTKTTRSSTAKTTRAKAKAKLPTKAKAATKSRAKAPPAEVHPSFAPVLDAFAGDRRVEHGRGWGSASHMLKVDGKIFAMTIGDELVIKIDRARAAELVDAEVGHFFEPRKDGRLMKEWVVVGSEQASWVELAREARRFVGGAR